MAARIVVLSAFTAGALAAAEPAVTAAAQLYLRQSGMDPALVGYISASSGCESTHDIIGWVILMCGRRQWPHL